LMLRLPVRRQAVVLSPQHVHRVLNETPEPFAADSSEKRAALSHFQPQGVLVSHGPLRTERRRFNEEVLDHRQAMHHLADSFTPLVEQEAARMLAIARKTGELDWDTYAQGWYRLVRRVVFGDSAADDHELNDLTVRLRRNANWAALRPQDKPTQARFFARIQTYLDRAEPGSLAGRMAQMPTRPGTMPAQQVPQWLFAFDAAGIATFRALALLAAHPQEAARARAEIDAAGDAQGRPLPFLRATVLESVRLWPTTPMVLRQTTRATEWEHGTMPANTGVLVYAPFFHRDDQQLPHAHRFTPALWLTERQDEDAALIPFSEGPASCPGRNLVLMLASAMLAALMDKGPDRHGLRLAQKGRLDPAHLPGTLDNYTLRFAVSGPDTGDTA
jgi:cytochrome P450